MRIITVEGHGASGVPLGGAKLQASKGRVQLRSHENGQRSEGCIDIVVAKIRGASVLRKPHRKIKAVGRHCLIGRSQMLVRPTLHLFQ